jgi:Spy/CpxP family protein refolding chaperone
MTKRISRILCLGSVFAAVATAPGFVTFAADDAAPPAAPTQPDANVPGGNRTRFRGNPPDANAPGGNLQGGRGGRNFGALGGLNLDQKQNELLREATQAESDELRKLNEKLQTAQKDLVRVVIAEKYDEKAVREKADDVAKIQSDITVLRAKAFATVAPTLKPEQREQIESSRAASGFITGAGFMFGGGGPGGPGFQPQDGLPQDRAFRRNNNNGGDPTQGRRRGGPPAAPGQ